MYPYKITRYQDPLSWLFQKFFSNPSVSLPSSINLVAKVHIFIKLIMYVLFHGCLWNSYKAFFHFHTWLCMSCDFTSSGFEMYFRSPCLVTHDVSIYYMMELQISLHISILHPRHHSYWNGILSYFLMYGRFYINDVVAFVILFFSLNCCHLFFGSSLILLFL